MMQGDIQQGRGRQIDMLDFDVQLGAAFHGIGAKLGASFRCLPLDGGAGQPGLEAVWVLAPALSPPWSPIATPLVPKARTVIATSARIRVIFFMEYSSSVCCAPRASTKLKQPSGGLEHLYLSV